MMPAQNQRLGLVIWHLGCVAVIHFGGGIETHLTAEIERDHRHHQNVRQAMDELRRVLATKIPSTSHG